MEKTALNMPPEVKTDTYSNVAVLVPCFNEELTISKVVNDFKNALPGAQIWVFDNNSTDRTSTLAKEAGAVVVPSSRQGKGNVIKHMFREVEAEIYIMVDGDDTYPAGSAREMIVEFIKGHVDMVVGVRMTAYKGKSFRKFHKFGNNLVAFLISSLFSSKITDVMSGYRVFSRAFAKSVPLMSDGFEIETEITLQALAKNFNIIEVPIPYGERPSGSFSKLNTFSDGFLVLKSIFIILKDYKPLKFFSYLSGFFCLISIFAGILPVRDYISYGYVYHVPLAVLATGTGILSALSISVGLILDTTSKYHNETFELIRRLHDK